MILAGLAIASVASSALGSIAGSYGAKAQKYQAETNAKIAKMQGKNVALSLSQEYNKSRASDVVMAAAQNRRGGSVEGIARASEQQYNWDVDYAEMSANLQESGLEAQAKQYDIASKQTLLGGALGAVAQGANYYDTMGKIGGSSQPATASKKWSSIGTSGYFTKKR